MVARKGYKLTEVGEIPEDWEVESLSKSIADFQSGVSVNSDQGSMAQVYILKTSAVSDGKVDLTHVKPVSEKEILRVKCHIKQDSIIISRMNTPDLVGACGYAQQTKKNIFLPDRLWQSIKSSKPTDFIWLTYLLNSDKYKFLIKCMATGTSNSMKNIAKEQFLSLAIPSPRFNEQTAIATALSDADALIDALEQCITKKRHIKQGAMQELLTGKRRLPGFEGERQGYKLTEVGEIPEDWDVSTIGDVSEKVGSGITPTGGKRIYCLTGRPFMRSQNVGWGKLLLDDIVFISDDIHARFPATEIKLHDVLLNITGASIGRCSIADERITCGNVNQHVCIIRPNKEKMDSDFLCSVILSSAGQKQIDNFQTGGNRQGLNFAQTRSIQLATPPALSEQTAIAAVLTAMDDEIAALEAKLSKAKQIKAGMMQELLTGRIRLV